MPGLLLKQCIIEGHQQLSFSIKCFYNSRLLGWPSGSCGLQAFVTGADMALLDMVCSASLQLMNALGIAGFQSSQFACPPL